VLCSAASGFSALTAQMENVFPEKYDESLSVMYRIEDRVVFIFREMVKAEYHQATNIDPVLNGYLKKALNRYWLLESIELKKELNSDSHYFTKRITKYIAKLPSSYDQAAFSYFLNNVRNEFKELAPFAAASEKAMEALKEAAPQKTYITAIDKTPDFFRKIPCFLKPLVKLDDKISALIDKLQQKYTLEKMILTLSALRKSDFGRDLPELGKLQKKLSEFLVKRIVSNLEVQLEAGLEQDAVTGIMKSPQGVMIKQVLYQGRIRTFVKELQKSETLAQLECFFPIMATLKGELNNLSSRTDSPASKATLAKMQKNLSDMQIVLRSKLLKATQVSAEFEKTVKDFSAEITSAEASQLIRQL